MNRYIVNEQNVKLTGRGIYDEDNNFWCALSGSGFECHFKGKALTIKLVGDHASEIPDNDANWVRYAVYVNGIRTVEGLLDSVIKTVPVICGTELSKEVEADIKFIKLSECAMSTLGICPIECDGVITPAPAKPLKLEFIGDSITCGYGVDEYDPERHFKTATEDFTKAYAYKTAKLLNADLRAFSISGWGIISGYTDNDEPRPEQKLPPYYTKTGFSYGKYDDRDGLAPQDIDHDFGKYVPDMVVINLGTNDSSYCKTNEERLALYTEKYADFLDIVHKCNPSAKLLCCLGIMGTGNCEAMEKAVEIFRKRSGFEQIYTMRFAEQDAKLGYGADWHPSPATHDKAAEALAERIRSIFE